MNNINSIVEIEIKVSKIIKDGKSFIKLEIIDIEEILRQKI